LTFIFLSFALTFAVIALIQYLTGMFEINRDIGIFVTFSIFFTLFFRIIFKGKKDHKNTNSNDDVNLY
jgi:hypothetical protein